MEARSRAQRRSDTLAQHSGELEYLRNTPHSIHACRESNELRGRHLMREGQWLE